MQRFEGGLGENYIPVILKYEQTQEELISINTHKVQLDLRFYIVIRWWIIQKYQEKKSWLKGL